MESPPSGIGKIYIKGGVVSNNEGRVRVRTDLCTTLTERIRPMTQGPYVHIGFWNSYPGQFPGQRGILTKTELRFTGENPRFARLAIKSNLLAEHRRQLSTRAAETQSDLSRYFSILREQWAAAQEKRLLRNVCLLIEKLLLDNPGRSNWLISENASPFRLVDKHSEARRIARRLDTAENIWLSNHLSAKTSN